MRGFGLLQSTKPSSFWNFFCYQRLSVAHKSFFTNKLLLPIHFLSFCSHAYKITLITDVQEFRTEIILFFVLFYFQLNITFNDEMTRLFEYPSETSLLEEVDIKPTSVKQTEQDLRDSSSHNSSPNPKGIFYCLHYWTQSRLFHAVVLEQHKFKTGLFVKYTKRIM